MQYPLKRVSHAKSSIKGKRINGKSVILNGSGYRSNCNSFCCHNFSSDSSSKDSSSKDSSSKELLKELPKHRANAQNESNTPNVSTNPAKLMRAAK